jgi:hypothetical protein
MKERLRLYLTENAGRHVERRKFEREFLSWCSKNILTQSIASGAISYDESEVSAPVEVSAFALSLMDFD